MYDLPNGRDRFRQVEQQSAKRFEIETIGVEKLILAEPKFICQYVVQIIEIDLGSSSWPGKPQTRPYR